MGEGDFGEFVDGVNGCLGGGVWWYVGDGVDRVWVFGDVD